MGYLYLNFLDNLEKGSKSWDDFYTTSLTEQYEVLKRKLGGYASGTLQEFIAMAFSANTLKYYNISMPSFDRRMKENRFGKQCIKQASLFVIFMFVETKNSFQKRKRAWR